MQNKKSQINVCYVLGSSFGLTAFRVVDTMAQAEQVEQLKAMMIEVLTGAKVFS